MSSDLPCIVDTVRDDTIWRVTGEEDEETIPDALFQRLEFVVSYGQPHHTLIHRPQGDERERLLNGCKHVPWSATRL